MPGVTSLVVAKPGCERRQAHSQAQRGQNPSEYSDLARSELEGNFVESPQERQPLRGR